MRIKDIFKFVAATCCFSVMTSSCSDWLAVDMEDGIMEDKLYETNEGFLAALNGVYTKMNETYASTLSMGIIDVMAQYYNVAQNTNHRYHVYANYSFDESTFESTSGNVWTNLYGLIANLNTLLEHCDESGAALRADYYPIVKGEALALRAMFHFDLLRIYGPIYGSETESDITIPYQETSSKDIQPLLSAKQVMENVVRDLKAASDLLSDDPVRTEGVMDSESEDLNETSDLRYRQYRLNYYAVQALLARAYLWMGNRSEAYSLATELIAENSEKEVFPWTPKGDVTSNIPDRLFSTEVMFGLYNLSRVNLYNSLFNESVSTNNILTFVGQNEADANGKLIYFYSDTDDLRRGTNMWSAETLEQSDDNGAVATQAALCFHKYEDISTTSESYRYMIPLIRMSEIYLIAAECTDDMSEAIGYVNDIRRNRNCVDLALNETDTESTVLDYITAEFAREVIGEGQLYFYYKRHAMTTVMSGTTFSASRQTANIDLSSYVWPLPDVETDRRVTLN